MAAPKGHAPYNVNGEGGRPKIYTEEFINKQADGLLEWLINPDNIYFEEFLLDQNIHPKAMYEWIKVNERFNDAYEIAHSRQKQRLLKGATKKEFSEGFTKFVLINNHGMSEKTETKISGDIDNPVAFALMNIPTTKDLVTDGKKDIEE